ncbi:MAG: chromate transporter [Lachnospiraceae bacterium]|nr:chromate transporter [Lachnospiraceae bacterium]
MAENRKQKRKLAFELFLYFFRIGWYTFGGGWSIIAQIQRDYVDKKHYVTNEVLLDLTSVGKSLPGVMVGNVTLLFGYHVAGVPGALMSLLGMSLPPILILTLVTYLYTWFRDNVYVARALRGVRAAVVPIIFSATLKLYPAALHDWFTYVILGAGVALLLFTDINAILIIVGAAVIGLLVSYLRRGKGGADAQAS